MRTHLSIPQQDLSHIHETAVLILSEIGIKTDHIGIRDHLADRGCRVEGERVFFSPDLIDVTIKEIPNSFNVYGRQIEQSITVGLENTYGINTGILPNIYDFDSGQVRRSTLADVRDTTRLLDAMEYVDAVYVSLVDATELAPHMVTLSDFAAVLANTTKPLLGPGVTNRSEAEAIVNIACAVRSGDSKNFWKISRSACLLSVQFLPCFFQRISLKL